VTEDPVSGQRLSFTILKGKRGRLDRYIATRIPDFSRTKLTALIRDGLILVNGQRVKPSREVDKGDLIELTLPEIREIKVLPEDIPLEIIYEDEHMLAVNKPPDFVVHPGRGHWGGTLANALLGHCTTLSDTGGDVRPGIVHRLDKDTSGIILAAKTNLAHDGLGRQFEGRTIKKHYLALVEGVLMLDGDKIDCPIGPSKYDREKRAVRNLEHGGKEALTVYKVRQRFERFSFLELMPKTGRTHQIRVHLEKIGHPVLCDHDYGRRNMITRSEILGDKPTEDETPLLVRQALHAWKIKFEHPLTHEMMMLEAPLAHDISQTLVAMGGVGE